MGKLEKHQLRGELRHHQLLQFQLVPLSLQNISRIYITASHSFLVHPCITVSHRHVLQERPTKSITCTASPSNVTRPLNERTHSSKFHTIVRHRAYPLFCGSVDRTEMRARRHMDGQHASAFALYSDYAPVIDCEEGMVPKSRRFCSCGSCSRFSRSLVTVAASGASIDVSQCMLDRDECHTSLSRRCKRHQSARARPHAIIRTDDNDNDEFEGHGGRTRRTHKC